MIRRSSATCSDPSWDSRQGSFTTPTPCSPVIEPSSSIAFAKDLFERNVGAVQGVLVGGIQNHGGVQISIPGVAECSDHQAVALSDRLDVLDHLGNSRARYGGIFVNRERLESGERGKDGAARLEQLGRLLRRARNVDVSRSSGLAACAIRPRSRSTVSGSRSCPKISSALAPVSKPIRA